MFSCFCRGGGAGSGVSVSRKPLNKAADADSCLSVISWVLGQAQGLSEGEGEMEAFGGGLAGRWRWGLVSPQMSILSTQQAFRVKPG